MTRQIISRRGIIHLFFSRDFFVCLFDSLLEVEGNVAIRSINLSV